MAETFVPTPRERMQHAEKARLMELGRWAQKVYFGMEHGTGPHDQLSLCVNSIPRNIAEDVARILNYALRRGGEVIILDFPREGDFTTRAQIVTSSSYVRQINHQHPFVKPTQETKSGDFSIWISPWDATSGTLYAGVEEISMREATYYTSWEEGADPEKRFAILTHEGKDPRVGPEWRVVLDFNLPGEGLKPSWRVNRGVVNAKHSNFGQTS